MRLFKNIFFAGLLAFIFILTGCAESKPIESQSSVDIGNERSVSYEIYKDGTAYAWTNFTTSAGDAAVDTALVRFILEMMPEYFDTYKIGGYIGGKVYSYEIENNEIIVEKPSSAVVELSVEEYSAIVGEYSAECDYIRECLDSLVNPDEGSFKKHK